MSILKAGHTIASLDEWKTYAGPKSPTQWVNGRSAKEVARSWLEGKGESLPLEVEEALTSNPNFGPAQDWTAEPEAKLKFDGFTGETRNSDLIVDVKDKNGNYLIAVEAKADEPFGQTVQQTLKTAEAVFQKNPRTNRVRRVHQLKEAILGVKATDKKLDATIRYQLLTACAGALCEAERVGCSRILVLIQEFISDETTDKKHGRNEIDLNSFVRHISDGRVSKVEPGSIYGPFNVAGLPILSTQIDLYIGKVTRNIRTVDR